MFDTMTITKAGGALCGSLLIFLLAKWAGEGLYHVSAGGHVDEVVPRVGDPSANALTLSECGLALCEAWCLPYVPDDAHALSSALDVAAHTEYDTVTLSGQRPSLSSCTRVGADGRCW